MKTLFVILVTTLLFWGFVLPFFFNSEREMNGEILRVATLSKSPEELKSEVIVEWLDLSVERGVTLDAFNLKEGTEKLLKSLVIEEAKIYKLPPSSLVISYSLREPYAYILNWKNCAIDEKGVLFPFSPFFTPKELPEIVFSPLKEVNYLPFEGITLEEFSLAKEILSKRDLLFPWVFSRVDLARVDPEAPFGGEIVLSIKKGERRFFVRMWKDEWEKKLKILSSVLSDAEKKEGIGIDLRLSSRVLVFR